MITLVEQNIIFLLSTSLLRMVSSTKMEENIKDLRDSNAEELFKKT